LVSNLNLERSGSGRAFFMDKKQLRAQLKERLLELTNGRHIEKSRKACEKLVDTPQFRQSDTIMFFLSMPHETDTTAAMLKAWENGKTVVVPKVLWEQKRMIPVQIDSLEAGLSTEVAGLRNPVADSPVPLEEIDLVVVPGLAFDKKGNRLGTGNAYYDNFFENNNLVATRCGFAFSEQLIDSIPADEYDKPMDLLVTDEEIIYFNNSCRGEKNGSLQV
jgi:5-formyltetrahydrofolate cyclo-ligase